MIGRLQRLCTMADAAESAGLLAKKKRRPRGRRSCILPALLRPPAKAAGQVRPSQVRSVDQAVDPGLVLDDRLLRRADAEGFHQHAADRKDAVGSELLVGLGRDELAFRGEQLVLGDRKSTRLNSSP